MSPRKEIFINKIQLLIYHKMIKKETTIFIIILLLGFNIIIPETTGLSFFEIWDSITGKASTQPLTVSVQTNAPPIIGNVTVYDSPVNPNEASNSSIFFSFIVTDADGDNNIVNDSAVANISRGGETTRYNNSFISPGTGTCMPKERGVNFKNFTCNISFVFYDGAGEWNISVRINDSAGAFAQNTTKTFIINELTAIVINPTSISFPTVGLADVNVSARVNITINNTGNDDISGREATGETINITAITLVGESSAATVIPTSNFSIGTDIDSGPPPSYCDLSRVNNTTRLINTTATSVSPYNNFSGSINGSVLLAQASDNFEVLSLCLLDVPDDLTAQNYSTTKSGAWTIFVY